MNKEVEVRHQFDTQESRGRGAVYSRKLRVERIEFRSERSYAVATGKLGRKGRHVTAGCVWPGMDVHCHY